MRRSGLEGEALTDELFRLVKIYNYVPEDMAEKYRNAVREEYDSYLRKAEERGN